MASTSTTLLPIAPAPPHTHENSKQHKRKRTDNDSDSPASTTASTSQASRKPRDGPKKKKAVRKTSVRKRSSLLIVSRFIGTGLQSVSKARPCDRCIKRGIAANCTEGHRKKAKYLLDDDELEQLKRNKSQSAPTPTDAPNPRPPTPPAHPAAPPDPLLPDSSTIDVPFDTNFPFGSEAANLEYSILSAILGNPSPPQDSQTPPTNFSTWPSTDSLSFQSPRLSTFPAPYADPLQPQSTLLSASPNSGHSYLTYPYQDPPRPVDLSESYQTQQSQSEKPVDPDAPLHPLQPRYPLDNRPKSPPLPIFLDEMPQGGGLLSPPNSNASPSVTSSNTDMTYGGFARSPSKLQSINDRVNKPYDYTEGYHFLMKHLPTRNLTS
ncbi:Transcriptional regulator of nonfermentable carbon utilization [Paramarasmius palmivorus]|uniref:Transcriptional regulator of nonfermentable carbon utilization n=1 Tax=Paramarasmius palmivorus TaxID=297713 RepID=A0AAW0DQA8_9AGAR